MEKHLNIQATKYSAPKAQLYRSGDNSVICDKEDKIAVLDKFCKDIGCKFSKGSFFFSKNSIIINNQFDNDLKIELINHLKKSHVAMNTLNNNYLSLHNETKELVRKLNPNKTEQEIHKLAHNLLEIISLRNHGNFFENHNRYGKSTNTFIEALKLSIPNELCQKIKSREQIKQELMQSNIEKIPVASFKKITEEYQKNRIGLESVKAIYNHHQKYLNNKSEIFKNNYKCNAINNHNKNWTYGVKDQYRAGDYANNQMEKENKAFEVLEELKKNNYQINNSTNSEKINNVIENNLIKKDDIINFNL